LESKPPHEKRCETCNRRIVEGDMLKDPRIKSMGLFMQHFVCRCEVTNDILGEHLQCIFTSKVGCASWEERKKQ